jgi:hypothetical protein
MDTRMFDLGISTVQNCNAAEVSVIDTAEAIARPTELQREVIRIFLYVSSLLVEDPVEVVAARLEVQLKRAKNIRPSMNRAPAAARRGRKIFPCNDRAAGRSPATSASTPVIFIVD